MRCRTTSREDWGCRSIPARIPPTRLRSPPTRRVHNAKEGRRSTPVPSSLRGLRRPTAPSNRRGGIPRSSPGVLRGTGHEHGPRETGGGRLKGRHVLCSVPGAPRSEDKVALGPRGEEGAAAGVGDHPGLRCVFFFAAVLNAKIIEGIEACSCRGHDKIGTAQASRDFRPIPVPFRGCLAAMHRTPP